MTPLASAPVDTLISGVAAALGFAVFGFILYRHVRNAHESRIQRLEAMARRLRGTFYPSDLLVPDRIIFTMGGGEARVEFRPPGKHDEGGTRLSVPLPKPAAGTLHVLPEGFAQSFLKMFGAQDLRVGDPLFDARYVVKATPESFAARVFHPDRRAGLILAIRKLEGMSDPTIDVGTQDLRIRVREEVGSEGRLMGLVGVAERLLEILQCEPDIELGDLRTGSRSTCPVCGSDLGDLVVRCAACKTPQHAECWTYVGQCSTYACSGTKFTA